MVIALCLLVFLVAYALNALTISVGYHRALAHRSVRLHPALRRAVIAAGPWITGLDPKAWVVMHRLHHEHSDTPADPHSPVNVGLVGILKEQLDSYKGVIRGLMKGQHGEHARDLDFELNALNTRGLWMLPYLTHAAVGIALSFAVGTPLLGLAYFFGMMSHPLQGGLVNSLGHAVGGRNFDSPDNSRNNHVVAWLCIGEGFQNNHHHAPASARFSYRGNEIDMGYGACLALEKLGLATIEHALLLPRPDDVVVPSRA